MSLTYVFIDLETTGLDPRRDAILEIAAIVWRDGQVVEAFSSLVNPNRPVPAEITQLTGITEEMAAAAPALFSLRSQWRALLGQHVLVGHNVDFDLGFLQEENLAYGNHRLDTLTLASILWPRAGRYSLASLAHYLQLPTGRRHRALDDARQTLALYQALQARAAQLPLEHLEELVAAADQIGWPEGLFFREVWQAQARLAFVADQPRADRTGRLFRPTPPAGRTLEPPDEEASPQLLDEELIAGLLRPGSNLSRAFPNYEYRPQQEAMTRAVIAAFNRQEHLLVEAGTGTGKSLAYLLPAAFWATLNERRVIVSTNTINLQDQLIGKDIPALQKLLPFDLRVAVRKGRGNYLCTRRFQQLRHRGPKSADEMALFARLLVWLTQTETGDISEVSLRTPGERLAWYRLNAETTDCQKQECATEYCPLHLARRRAETAHIVIVNHALLLADAANANQVLPPFRDLILDEAHHLEAAVTDGLSFSADKRFLETVLEEVNKPRAGLVGVLEAQLERLPAGVAQDMLTIITRLRQDADLATVRIAEFFETVQFFVRDYTRAPGEFAQEVRLTPAVRSQPDFDEVILSWDNLNKPLARLAKGLEMLALGLGVVQRDGHEIADGEELQTTLSSYALELTRVRQYLDQIVAQPTSEMIYWVEVWRDRLVLHAAPLHVGPLVEQHLLHRLDAIIMTSATLRTAPPGRQEAANFDYLRTRLQAQEMRELAVGSPFDYQKNTLLYLCTDIPEPNQPGYQRYVEQAIVDVARVLGGRTLALFTAYRQLRETAEGIQGALLQDDILVLAQGDGDSRQDLLAQFAAPDSRRVLLGAKSFWEGVDVPGEPLTAVIIVKLPFDVPSDPIFAARSETFDNAFYEYAIPEAVLRFRQGFGRLIRRHTDEGIVVVLDRRVISRRYGELFLQALPPCTVLRQRAGRLSEIITRWQNRDRNAAA